MEMEPGHANSRERSKQVIDAQIKVVEAYARSLKRRRNALSSLPPKVFADIFFMLCLPGTSSLEGEQDHHIARLRVSHVCHQWREIALNQSLLWSHINFSTLSSAGAAEILVRSKSAPLNLEADNCLDDIQFRKEFQAHVPHIRRLRTGAGHTLLHETLREIVSPAPILEYFSLSFLDLRRNRRRLARSFIPDTLFNGSAPRLSCLELSACNISWKAPLLKGLKDLKILSPSTRARPELAVWLDALDEMPKLVTLTLHSASPVTSSILFDVQRTITLPSLTRLDILGHLGDCGLAVAHLDLPALTSLRLTAISSRLLNDSDSDLETIIPHISRHAHGSQDTQPLQSAVISCNDNHANILAWLAPDIDLEMHDPPTLLEMTRVALSFRSDRRLYDDDRLDILEVVMAGLPLNGLVTLATHDQKTSLYERGHLSMQDVWHHLSQYFPLLQRVRLAPFVALGFIVMLQKDDGGRERPLLPSLKLLTVVNFSLYDISKYPIRDALMRRVEQGVPVEKLDLRMCAKNSFGYAKAWLGSLTEFVDVLGPEETFESFEEKGSTWNTLARGPFVDDDDVREDDDSDSGGD